VQPYSEIQGLILALTSGDDARAEAAVPLLAARAAQAFPELEDLLSSPDGDARWWAVRTLAEVQAPQTSPLLLKALSDGDAAVRQCAALALRKRPDPQAIPALISKLDDPDHLCASLSADALVRIGPEAVPALLEVMQNGNPATRLEAVRALAMIGDRRSIPALFAAQDEDSALMEYWANEGLERLGVGWTFFKP
jgi:HEAT repeat protein